MGQFGVMIGQLVGFLIMLMVGYGCVRLRFYGQTALDGMCSLLLNVLIPVLVFSNAVDGADRAQLASNWGVMLLTAVMYALLILVFWLVAELLRLKGSRRGLRTFSWRLNERIIICSVPRNDSAWWSCTSPRR